VWSCGKHKPGLQCASYWFFTGQFPLQVFFPSVKWDKNTQSWQTLQKLLLLLIESSNNRKATTDAGHGYKADQLLERSSGEWREGRIAQHPHHTGHISHAFRPCPQLPSLFPWATHSFSGFLPLLSWSSDGVRIRAWKAGGFSRWGSRSPLLTSVEMPYSNRALETDSLQREAISGPASLRTHSYRRLRPRLYNGRPPAAGVPPAPDSCAG